MLVRYGTPPSSDHTMQYHWTGTTNGIQVNIMPAKYFKDAGFFRIYWENEADRLVNITFSYSDMPAVAFQNS